MHIHLNTISTNYAIKIKFQQSNTLLSFEMQKKKKNYIKIIERRSLHDLKKKKKKRIQLKR